MLGLITSDKVVAGLILGIPLSVIALTLIWIKPRRPVAAWALVSVLIVAAVTAGIWGALRSGTGQATTSPAPSGPVGGGTVTCAPGTALHITAKGIAYSTNCLAAPANTPVTIAFQNDDAGTQHDIHIYSTDPATHADAASLFQGDLVLGIASATYDVPALPAGTYFFHCDVHPTRMFGTFVVGGSG